jgi:hypothetical protein
MDYYCKTAQVLLVGLKTDLRDEKSLNQAVSATIFVEASF